MNDLDGEKELVLGNKQLLGIFFVATLLCGVFFAMGYVVGGNSAKAGAAAASATADNNTPDQTSEGKREEPQPPAATDSASAVGVSGDTGTPLPGSEPLTGDNPAAAGSQPPVAAAAPPAAAPVASVTKPAAGASGLPPGHVPVSEPEKAASYVQIAAEARPSADDLVKILRQAGLPSILTTSSKPDLFRVLVGPYRSSLSLADVKIKLKDLGYDNLIVVKP